jgi:hypothetical protein
MKRSLWRLQKLLSCSTLRCDGEFALNIAGERGDLSLLTFVQHRLGSGVARQPQGEPASVRKKLSNTRCGTIDGIHRHLRC